jgi:hypothetical protein
VSLKFFQYIKKNRLVGNRRPVFLTILVLIVLTTILMSANGIVQAEEFSTNPDITPTPTNPIEVPASGEPVILQPGNNARLISPLIVQLITEPGEDGLVRIELIGHDNRIIFRKLMEYRAYIGKTLLIDQAIPFEIRNDESARLQVVLEDKKGKTIYLNSISLTLLGVRGRESSGEPAVNPHFRINKPDVSTPVKGKNLILDCDIKPINNTPVNIELVAKDGHTMASRLVQITLPNNQTESVHLSANLPFSVSTPTQVTLRIRQESNNLIKGTVLLWSNKVTLSP